MDYRKFLESIPNITRKEIDVIMTRLNGKKKPKKRNKKTARKSVKKKEVKKTIKIKRKKPAYDRTHINLFNEYRWDIKECQKCGNNLCLQIHHINKDHKDNHPLNLIKLCLPCHCEAHKGDSIYWLMISRLNFIQNK